jgi:hypothetical protein
VTAELLAIIHELASVANVVTAVADWQATEVAQGSRLRGSVEDLGVAAGRLPGLVDRLRAL